MGDKMNYYELLGVNRDATLKEIKDAYRKKAILCHPDNNKDMAPEECHKLMCLVNLAYDTLRNPEKREIYDETLDIRGCGGTEESSDHGSYARTKSTDQYEYYNSVDYDEELQREFLRWLKEFIEDYINHVLIYIFKSKIDNYDVIDYLYESFGEIFHYEESYVNTNSKRNSR